MKKYIVCFSILFLCGCNFQHRFFEMPLPCEHSKDVFCSPVIHEVSTAGNYYIEYARVPNNYIIYQESGEYKCADNTIYISVKYNGKTIIQNKDITKFSMGDIPYIEKMILMLAADNFFKIYESDDKLYLETEMSYPDTDWGYHITISISKAGEITYTCIDNDEGYLE